MKQKIAHILDTNEQLGLENETALHQTRTDLLNSKALLEFSLKSYYDSEINAKAKEIEQLKAEIK